MGTPQELTDDCGNAVWVNYEWVWGGRYTHHYTSQSLNGCAILETDLQPIRFQGQFYDVETGLHYNRFRYYDSDVGMFIQRDPIGLLGGWIRGGWLRLANALYPKEMLMALKYLVQVKKIKH